MFPAVPSWGATPGSALQGETPQETAEVIQGWFAPGGGHLFSPEWERTPPAAGTFQPGPPAQRHRGWTTFFRCPCEDSAEEARGPISGPSPSQGRTTTRTPNCQEESGTLPRGSG